MKINNFTKKALSGLFLITALTLSACSTTQDTALNESSYSIDNFKSLEFKGKIAIIEANGRNSLSYFYKKDNNFQSLELLSPVGTTVASIYIADNFARLNMDGQSYDSNSGQKLIYDIFHINLPVDKLYLILCGAIDNLQIKDNISYGSYMGFDIVYKNFKERDNLTVPSRIELSDKKVKLIISIN